VAAITGLLTIPLPRFLSGRATGWGWLKAPVTDVSNNFALQLCSRIEVKESRRAVDGVDKGGLVVGKTKNLRPGGGSDDLVPKLGHIPSC
jgi:hypothetical protein